MADDTPEKPKSAEGPEALAPATPLIFISHDTRDAELAEAFSRLLSSVSTGILKSFRSSDGKGSQGIEYGTEWYPHIMAKLETSSDVVCLLTQRSVDRPWILYEAGVARGKLSTPVYGIALGIPLTRVQQSGPFAQFQNCPGDDEERLTKVVLQLLRRIPSSDPDPDMVLTQVKAFKVKSAEVLKKLGDPKKEAAKTDVVETSAAKLFEEIKIMFQDLPSRIDGRLSESAEPARRRRFRRFHPLMLEEMMHVSDMAGDPIAVLFLVGMFKDDFPWLYEVGRELYVAMKSGDSAEMQRLVHTLHRLSEVTFRGPWAEEFGGSKEAYMLVREMPMMLDRLMRTAARSAKRGPKREKPPTAE